MTVLAYIPLYNPARCPVAPLSDDHIHIRQVADERLHCPLQSTSVYQLGCSRTDMTPQSRSEPNLLDNSLFETYDNSTSTIPLPGATTISKFLVLPKPPNQVPTKHGKSAGRVLTSLENLQILQQKEKEKQEANKKLIDSQQKNKEKGTCASVI